MQKYFKEFKCGYYLILLTFIILFIITAMISYYAPYSGRGFVENTLYPVYSKLNGQIEEVYVKDGEYVKKGTAIFKLDDTQIKFNIENLRFQYKNEENQLASLDYKILEAEKIVLKNKLNLQNTKDKNLRYSKLYIYDDISKEKYEEVKLNYEIAKKDLEISKFYLSALIKERGKNNSENEILKSLEAQIESSQKDLKDSVIRAAYSGNIYLDQLYKGQVVNSNQSYGYIYEKENLVIYVDIMEKGVINLKNDQRALIVFDAIPGKIYEGKVKRINSLLESGYTAPGQLQSIEEDIRWIRTTGRSRVKIILEDGQVSEPNIASGSKLAVCIQNEAHPIISFIAHLWLKCVAYLNFIY